MSLDKLIELIGITHLHLIGENGLEFIESDANKIYKFCKTQNFNLLQKHLNDSVARILIKIKDTAESVCDSSSASELIQSLNEFRFAISIYVEFYDEEERKKLLEKCEVKQ